MAQCKYRGQTYNYQIDRVGRGSNVRDFALQVGGKPINGHCGFSVTAYRDQRPHDLDIWGGAKRGKPDWASNKTGEQRYDIICNSYDNAAILKLDGKVQNDWESFTVQIEDGEPERLRIVDL